MIFVFQCLIAILAIASLAYAIPIDVGHYAAPAYAVHAPVLHHAPLIHAPVHKVIAEPVVSVFHLLNCFVKKKM